jgi:tRNA (cmo5U34)-methyltransferase
MGRFFDLRAAGYERHMAEHTEDLAAFCDSVADTLPDTWQALRILDLGIGTGLELCRRFELLPTAYVTGIDLSQETLDTLAAKKRPWSKQVRRIHGSSLEIDLGRAEYDGVATVMTLHHWVPDVKLELYPRIHRSLVAGSMFVNADYVESEKGSARGLAAYAAEVTTIGIVSTSTCRSRAKWNSDGFGRPASVPNGLRSTLSDARRS